MVCHPTLLGWAPLSYPGFGFGVVVSLLPVSISVGLCARHRRGRLGMWYTSRWVCLPGTPERTTAAGHTLPRLDL